MAQLEKRAKDLSYQLKNTSQSASPEAYNGLKSQLHEVRGRMDELGESSKSTMSIFKGGVMVALGNVMTKGIEKVKEWVSEAKEWVKEGINMANGAEGVVTAFDKLNNSKQHLADMRDATKKTISDLKLMEKTVRADEMGIGIQNMANLLKFAQVQAKKMKKDVDYMADSIVDGLGRKSTMILDNLGISANQVQQEVKKTGDFTAAVLKIVTERLKEQGDEALTGAEKAAQSAAKWENAQLRVGQKFQWLGETWDKISGDMADDISTLVGETKSLTEQYNDQIQKVADLEVNSTKMVERYKELKSKASFNKDEQIELNNIMNTLSNTIPGIVTEFDKYGNALSINTDKVYEYIKAEKARLRVVNADLIEEYEKKKKFAKAMADIAEADVLAGTTTQIISLGKGQTITQKRDLSPAEIAKKQEDLKKLRQEQLGYETEYNRLTGSTLEQQVEMSKEQIRIKSVFNGMNKKELDKWIKDEHNAKDQYMEIAKQIYDQRFGSVSTSDPKTPKTDTELQEQKKALSEMLEKLETTHQSKLAEIKRKYLAGEIETEADLNRKKFSQEQAYYLLRESALENFVTAKTKTEVKDDVDKLIAKQQNERLEKEIAFRTKLEKIILDADPRKKEVEAYKDKLSAFEIYGATKIDLQLKIIAAETAEEKKLLEQKYQAFLLLEKEHQDNLQKITDDENAKKKKKAEDDFTNEFQPRKDEMQLELNDLMQKASSFRDRHPLRPRWRFMPNA